MAGPNAESLDVQSTDEAPRDEAREQLVHAVSRQTGITDSRVLAAFTRVPRHVFVPQAQRARAYEDAALPVANGQTISQPSMVAIMLAALQPAPTDRVLEVGAGTGYAAALLGELVRAVYAIEIVPELAHGARQRLADLAYANVQVFEGNGRQGLPAFAPYDRILVSAGSEDVPDELIAQLRPGGRLAIPVGNDYGQELLIGEKTANGEMNWQHSTPCIFVPLVGRA